MVKEQDKGTYVLLIKLAKTQKIKPGKLPETAYKKGMYLYVGRARKGLRARIRRHLKCQKKIFWHVDYLLQKAKIESIWIRENYFDECITATEIQDFRPAAVVPFKGFGSSDCSCASHLFYFSPGAKGLKSLRKKIGFEKVNIDGNNP